MSSPSAPDNVAQLHQNGMPPLHPAAMPVQSLSEHSGAPQQRRGIHWPRLAVFSAAFTLLAAGVAEMYFVLSLGGLTPLEWAMLVLFCLTFGWIALAAVSSVAGFIRLLRRPQGLTPARLEASGRTAILMPCYNENPAMLVSSIEAMVEDLDQFDANRGFEWFILSDTRNPEQALKEEQSVALLRERLAGKAQIWYRRRRDNTDRKTGNLTDFLTQWGGRYDYLLVLDADSILSAEVIINLANRMEATPSAGLIQTVPQLVGGVTLVARLQQFANRIYGQVVGGGMASWANPEGNFWGHNAIIRRTAFMHAAGLPHLPGKAPFGGTIMSHDFVEAALLRRAGWDVIIADDLQGSYEESPPSMVDLAVRDRRWCQGNLQHSKVIHARGLHWVNRFHMLTGIMSYLSSPLWLALILVGILMALQAQYIRPEYFADTYSLFPDWPRQDAPRAVRLFILTMLVLLIPKFLGTAYTLMRRDLRRGLGGSLRVTSSVLTEILLSAAIAPIMMCIHCGAVASTLLGKDSGWAPQRRDDGSLPWLALLYRHRWHTLMGIALALIAWSNSWALLAWLSPAIIGLVLATPLSAMTASQAIGRWFLRAGLLATPEEKHMPEVVARRERIEGVYEQNLTVIPSVQCLCSKPELVMRHLALTHVYPNNPHETHEALARVKIMDARTTEEALAWLSSQELDKVLMTPGLFRQLAALSDQPAVASL